MTSGVNMYQDLVSSVRNGRGGILSRGIECKSLEKTHGNFEEMHAIQYDVRRKGLENKYVKRTVHQLFSSQGILTLAGEISVV